MNNSHNQITVTVHNCFALENQPFYVSKYSCCDIMQELRGMAGKFVDTISIFNRKRNSVKMNIAGFAKIFHEQIDEIL